MKLEIPITVEFDGMWEMVNEIKALQTYKLSENDDMLLVDRDDVADILKKHVRAKPKRQSAQPEQLGTNLAEVGTEQKYDPFVWNDNTDGLIGRAHLLKRLQDFVEWCRDDRLDGTKFCIDVIKDEPSAQPEVIHCNSCKYWTQSTGKMTGYGLGRCDFHDADLVTCNGYCYWAERRTNG